MAIDYAVDFSCQVRQQISNAELLNLLISKGRYELNLDAIKASPGYEAGRSEDEWTIKLVTQTATGSSTKTLRMSDLRREIEPLKELAAPCTECPVNVWRRDFGCTGAINYPISSALEHWLLSRLPDDLKSERGLALVAAFESFPFDCSDVEAARQRENLYELKRPAERKWGGLFSKRTVRSSQVLKMSVLLGNMSPTHARLVSLLVGYMDTTGQPTNPPLLASEQDERSILQFHNFFRLIAFAGVVGATVLIDG